MDIETIAKDLVASYLANNKLPKPDDVSAIAKQVVDFYKAMKAELKVEQPEYALDFQNYKTPAGPSER